MIKNMSREIKHSVQSRTLHIDESLVEMILSHRIVEVASFCLMPNHFHLLLKEVEENGIAKYMQRILTAYTKYFNTRHAKTGHLFQGSYKSVHIENDTQLMHVSAYIHKNPCEIYGWAGKEDMFPWSSYQDYVSDNRFENLLVTHLITDRFQERGIGTYRKFVSTSPAKEISKELFKM